MCDTRPCKWPHDVVSGYRSDVILSCLLLGRVNELFEHGLVGDHVLSFHIVFVLSAYGT